jgi:hypothetical protein
MAILPSSLLSPEKMPLNPEPKDSLPMRRAYILLAKINNTKALLI